MCWRGVLGRRKGDGGVGCVERGWDGRYGDDWDYWVVAAKISVRLRGSCLDIWAWERVTFSSRISCGYGRD